jgi:hypothetical protein
MTSSLSLITKTPRRSPLFLLVFQRLPYEILMLTQIGLLSYLQTTLPLLDRPTPSSSKTTDRTPPLPSAQMSTFFDDRQFPTPIPDPVTGRLDPNDPAVKARESKPSFSFKAVSSRARGANGIRHLRSHRGCPLDGQEQDPSSVQVPSLRQSVLPTRTSGQSKRVITMDAE